jgi:hypothetical protein
MPRSSGSAVHHTRWGRTRRCPTRHRDRGGGRAEQRASGPTRVATAEMAPKRLLAWRTTSSSSRRRTTDGPNDELQATNGWRQRRKAPSIAAGVEDDEPQLQATNDCSPARCGGSGERCPSRLPTWTTSSSSSRRRLAYSTRMRLGCSRSRGAPRCGRLQR